MKTAVVILSFDRPHYLKEVLNSMRRQTGVALEEFDFYLFQDGLRNAVSGRLAASEGAVNECCAAFQAAFPSGQVRLAPGNLGVGLNFLRAEFDIFRGASPYEQALFFEDDMVLSPRYFAICLRLLDMMQIDPRIGMVAAYGSFVSTADEQRGWSNGLVHMSQNWGFGLTRSFWERRQAVLDRYYEIIEFADPRHLPHDQIYEYFHELGYGQAATGQDGAIDIATCHLDAVRVMPFVSNARYIGATGLHATPASFAEAGFDRTVWVDCDADIRPLEEGAYRRMLEDHRKNLVNRRVDARANRRQIHSFEDPRTFVAAFIQDDSRMLYLHPELKTACAVVSGKGLLVTQPGMVLWGPYLPVSPGRYRVRVRLDVGGQGRFRFDVALVHEGEFKVVTEIDLVGEIDATLELEVEKPSRVEFRVSCQDLKEPVLISPRLIALGGGAS